jgi:dipeptidase E
MHKCSVLLISGGNTYHLLRNIKRNKMDEAIIEFAKNKDKVVAGFSAGALILTPRIDNIEIDDYDENIVGLKDLSALGLVSYEVFPHYSSEYKSAIDEYLNENPGVEVKTIRDEEFIIDKC